MQVLPSFFNSYDNAPNPQQASNITSFSFVKYFNAISANNFAVFGGVKY